ncbi:Uncharacterized conserved protein YlxW, UPF0749 family [Salinibacillus kushneri]|uniref:Uncharacterized conserved protein YlxW, UPF0749 family n=1 Tax=Salinibacillus kushneri TaxID=237682 RepID=A0A1I0HMV8_9BACI|nr:Uncharacterized conserved protein YlxW, UPF0749 family [Salinibacillus kushneri]
MKRNVLISIAALLAGLMGTILFQSNQAHEERDSRDLWEVRTEIHDKQETQQNLYTQIHEAEQKLDEYQSQNNKERIELLKESVQKLKKRAGLTEIKGEGIKITIKPILVNSDRVQEYPEIPPELLQRLFNELYTYGANDIAIENERIIQISPVRDVNGETYVNNRPLPSVPVEISVLAEDAKELMEYMQVSKVNDYFAVENLEVQYQVDFHLTLPAYQQHIDLEYIRSAESEEGGK